MIRRIAPAVLLLGFLPASANAQKDKPKPTKPADVLAWETVATDKASKMTTKRALVPGGWLVVVQNGDDMTLTFLPDAGHRWSDDASPSDVRPGKPQSDDLTKAAADKLKIELEQSRAAALAERDKALAAQKKADEELKRVRAELEKAKSEKAKKDKKPKKGEKGDQASDSGKEADRQRISEALGLAAREESQKAKAIAEQARAKETAARQESLQLKEKVEVIAQQLQKQLAETKKLFEHTRANDELARAEAAQTSAEVKRLRADLDVVKKEAERLKQLLDKKKK